MPNPLVFPPNNLLYQDDCFNIFPTLEDNSIDLILTDPPYFISRKSGYTHSNSEEYLKKYGKHTIDFGEWDQTKFDLNIILSECYRILKPHGTLLIFYDVWKMQELKECAETVGFKQPRIGVWNKTNPVPINSKINYLSNAKEFFASFVKQSKPTFHSQYDTADYYIEEDENIDTYYLPILHGKERQKHPTQKPLALIESLLLKHSNENDLVLDCFAGTGTTGVACQKHNRQFILVEKDENYCQIIKNRLNQN